jgi:hypothetical protein
VAIERLPGGDRPPAHRDPPVAVGRRQLDLAEDEVDHAVEELVLGRQVVVERHRADAELLGQPAHRQRLDSLAGGELDRSLDDAILVERRARLGCGFQCGLP